MNKKLLSFISLIVSSLALLYLLFINLWENRLVASDWIVVSIDLFVKVIIESYLTFSKEDIL